MKFTDILDLARQGYKPSDIKELLSIDTDTKPETEPDTKSTDTKSEPEQETDTKSEPDPEPEPNYKKLYEDALKKLVALQKANQRQQVDEPGDNVNDIIREVFY